MDMTKFVEELKSLAGKNGEQAWSIVEAWYTRDGRSRRLSLHDLHDLSKAIADAFNAHDDEIRRECFSDTQRIDWLMRHIPGDVLRALLDGDMSCTNNVLEFRDKIDAIMGKEAGE